MIIKNHNLRIGLVITVFMVALIVVGFFWTPYNPDKMNASAKFESPSLSHLLGTDNFGRDIFSRVLKGAGTTLLIALSVVGIGVFFGMLIGSLTGYFGGAVDEVLMRVNDSITAFPSILLALVLISLLGPGRGNVVIALGILFVPSFSRIVRGEFVKYREMDYVRRARLMGASHFRIMFIHILPNAAPVILSSAVIGFNNAVLAEAAMSYLGIGASPPAASLGYMLSDSKTFLSAAPWYALGTGAVIVLLILGFSLVGEGISGAPRRLNA